MMPPVSLPRKGGTQSARAGVPSNPPQVTSRAAAKIFRIEDSMSLALSYGARRALKRTVGHVRCRLTPSVAALHLTEPSRGGTVRRWVRLALSGLHMRDLAPSFKRFGHVRIAIGVRMAIGALFAVLAFGHPARAANPLELNFGLFGPSYDGRVAECERALGTISTQFQEKESTFWNSQLRIMAYGNIHEIAFRPWQS